MCRLPRCSGQHLITIIVITISLKPVFFICIICIFYIIIWFYACARQESLKFKTIIIITREIILIRLMRSRRRYILLAPLREFIVNSKYMTYHNIRAPSVYYFKFYCFIILKGQWNGGDWTYIRQHHERLYVPPMFHEHAHTRTHKYML